MSKTVLEKIGEGRQFRDRDMALEIREQNEPDTYIVEGYATTYNQPYVLYSDDEVEIREQVDPHAFDETDMSDVIMQYDHQGRVFARLSNNTLSLLSDDHGLLIRADLGGTEMGRNLYEEIAGGYTNKMSFGFTVPSGGDITPPPSKEGNKRFYLRTITKIGKLYDVSAVSLPANDATEISARSYVNGVLERDRVERLAEENRQKELETLRTRMHLMEVENGNQRNAD